MLSGQKATDPMAARSPGTIQVDTITFSNEPHPKGSVFPERGLFSCELQIQIQIDYGTEFRWKQMMSQGADS
jgi:hypothetical protein